jgi:hypothetical protein
MVVRLLVEVMMIFLKLDIVHVTVYFLIQNILSVGSEVFYDLPVHRSSSIVRGVKFMKL